MLRIDLGSLLTILWLRRRGNAKSYKNSDEEMFSLNNSAHCNDRGRGWDP